MIDLAIWVMYFISTYFAVFWLLVILENKIKDETPGKLPKNLPLVTIALPIWNEEKSLVATLKSVLALDYPRKKLHIILVDDHSTDSTPNVIKEFLRTHAAALKNISIQSLRHTVNKGKGSALNTALKHAKGELFICLDADSFVKPNTLKIMIPYFSHKNVASVLPLMKLRTVKRFVLHLQYVEYLVNFFLKKVMSMLDCIHVTPGPFAAYRTSILRKVGGFATDNLTEDLEMALRLQKHNYKIIQLMNARVTTLAPTTMKAWFQQRNRWYKGTLMNLYLYKKMFFAKKYGEFGLFQLPMVLGAATVSIFFALFVIWQHMLRPFLLHVYDMSFISFNMRLVSEQWVSRLHFLDANYMILFFSLVLFGFGLGWIIYAFKYTEERVTASGVTSSALFMVIYPFFLSMVWWSVILDLARGKKQRW